MGSYYTVAVRLEKVCEFSHDPPGHMTTQFLLERVWLLLTEGVRFEVTLDPMVF